MTDTDTTAAHTPTPGPWRSVRSKAPTRDGEFDFAVVAEMDGKDQIIAEAFGRVDYDVRPCAAANARLIAAAPAMLEALKIARREMSKTMRAGDKAYDVVETAIAAATSAEGA